MKRILFKRSFLAIFVMFLNIALGGPSFSVDNHQNGWTNMNWSLSTTGKSVELSQDFSPLRIDWPTSHSGWSFWYHIQYCWQKKAEYGAGGTCGYFGVGLYANSNNEYFGNFDLGYSEAKDFKITNFDSPTSCERRDPSQNIKSTNYIVCWTGIKLRENSNYRLKMFANPMLGDNWWTASFQDLGTGKTLVLGNIQGLGNDYLKPMAFLTTHVGYGGPVTKCDSVPVADYLVSNLKSNGQELNYSGFNSGSCTTSAVAQSSKAENGFFLRTGATSPSTRQYSTSAGTSFTNPESNSNGQLSPGPSGSSTVQQKPPVPSFSLVNFTGNKMNITVNLGSNKSSFPDKVYLVSPKLGISSNKPLSGNIVGSIATWAIEFDKSLNGILVPIEIISERSGIKSDSLMGSYALPGVKCPEIIDEQKGQAQPKVKGFIFTGTNQRFIRVGSNDQIQVSQPADLVGCYIEPSQIKKESPDWQIGVISRDGKGFYWTNGAGVSWRLKLIDNGTRLETDKSNPYYQDGNIFELEFGATKSATTTPSRPSNYKSRFVGDLAVISVEMNKGSSVPVEDAYLVSPSLGISEKNRIRGTVAGKQALIEIPLRPSMLGKKYPISIYFTNERGKSKPLNVVLIVPTSVAKANDNLPASSQRKLPKTIICSRPNQTRAFEGDSCPPGWEKR